MQSRLGRGSVFTVTLPLVSPTAVSAGDPPRSEAHEARELPREVGEEGAIEGGVASEAGREAKP